MSLREPAREQPVCSQTVNYVVTVWVIICIESGTIGIRGNSMMVQYQIQLTMRRTQREMMGAVCQRHQRERPRELARAPRREQEERDE